MQKTYYCIFIVHLCDPPTFALEDNPLLHVSHSFISLARAAPPRSFEKRAKIELNYLYVDRSSKLDMDVELNIWRNLEALDFGKWKVQPKEWKWQRVRLSRKCLHIKSIYKRIYLDNHHRII